MNWKKIAFGTDADVNVGLPILRVFIGAALLTHGWGKMFGGLEQFTGFVASLGVPAPHVMAFLAAFAECFGSMFLIAGLLTRPAAFLIVCTMAVAIGGAHKGAAFSVQELAWLYLVPALFFLLKGAGRWSLDRLISRQPV